ncbi:hypothetical protein AAEX28_07105 [Lentisphaerota bacterium WC36G]|nr:hypothetical protein LJT99_09970 [Lentisphaerae bacterium WC36]
MISIEQVSAQIIAILHDNGFEGAKIEYAPKFDFQSLNSLQILVLPSNVEEQKITRNSKHCTHNISIGFGQSLGKYYRNRKEELANHNKVTEILTSIDSLKELLLDRQLTSELNFATVTAVEHSPRYSTEDLRTDLVFVSALNLKIEFYEDME